MGDRRRTGRLRLALLAALFFAPFVAAWLLYDVFPDWRPEDTTNYGTLVSPARPLPDLALTDANGAPLPASALRGKWTLLYVGADRCGDPCLARLLLVRQVRATLNEKRLRVQRAYIAPSAAAAQAAETQLRTTHPDLLIAADVGAAGARAADFFRPGAADAIYLVDPHRNWLMVYTGTIDPRGLQKDLKKLLRASQIG